ncbi:MAG TPA: hypothetical protein VEA16_03465 [Vicinamibacterales bacterium]|nr:hypothetical protein [Vicinamibacterales bacterium]
MNIWYAAAAIVAAMTCAVHVVVGGRELVGPLLASRDMHRVTVLTHYYCWHLVSVALAAIALGLALAAWDPQWRLLGIASTVLAAAFGLLNIGYALAFRLSPRLLPQWLLFAAIALPGALG